MTTATETSGVEQLTGIVERIERAETAATRRDLVDGMVRNRELISLVAQEPGSDPALQELIARLQFSRLRIRGRVREFLQEVQRTRQEQQEVRQAAQRRAVVAEIQAPRPMLNRIPDHLRGDLETFVSPNGYTADIDGVWKLREGRDRNGQPIVERVQICPRPIFISSRGRDVESGSVQVTITWLEPGSPMTGASRWRSKTVNRLVAADAKQLIALAGHGAPVTSADAVKVVEWLRDFEAANAERIPTIDGTNHLGWQKDGPNGTLGSFLLPDMHIRTDAHPHLTLFPPDGFRKVAAGWCASGTAQTRDREWAGWLDTWAVASRHPIMAIGVYAAIASILLEPLASLPGEKPTPCIVDLSGETSTGKTTWLKFLGSVWGRPDDTDGNLASWSTTQVGIERLAGFLYSVPLLLDESKRASEKMVPQVTYMLCNGQGKVRGATHGNMRPITTWRNYTFSTGEKSLTKFSKDGGTVARTIPLTGRPIIGDLREGQLAARLINAGAQTNYGILGRKVAAYLVQNQASWPALKKHWVEVKNDYATFASGNVGGRIAGHIAMLDLARKICEALGLPKPEVDPLETLIHALRSGMAASGRPEEALMYVHTWAVSNQAKFIGSLRWDPSPANRVEAFGRWDTHKNDWSTLNILPIHFRECLKKVGCDPDEVVELFSKRGWLKKGAPNGTSSVRMGRHATRCYSIHRVAIEKVLGDVPDSPEIQELNAATAVLPDRVDTISPGFH